MVSAFVKDFVSPEVGDREGGRLMGLNWKIPPEVKHSVDTKNPNSDSFVIYRERKGFSLYVYSPLGTSRSRKVSQHQTIEDAEQAAEQYVDRGKQVQLDTLEGKLRMIVDGEDDEPEPRHWKYQEKGLIFFLVFFIGVFVTELLGKLLW